MKIYCRKEMLYPVIRFKDDPLNWGLEYREVKKWFDIADNEKNKEIVSRYKIASRDFQEALKDIIEILEAGIKGSD